ncbi:hypothetical protein FIBSPDRAFT_876551, partial [Athelia psychrophila]
MASPGPGRQTATKKEVAEPRAAHSRPKSARLAESSQMRGGWPARSQMRLIMSVRLEKREQRSLLPPSIPRTRIPPAPPPPPPRKKRI